MKRMGFTFDLSDLFFNLAIFSFRNPITIDNHMLERKFVSVVFHIYQLRLRGQLVSVKTVFQFVVYGGCAKYESALESNYLR